MTARTSHASPAQARKAVRFALAQVGKPYVWGAAGPGSFDCSGLTMSAWQQGGVSLPHSAPTSTTTATTCPATSCSRAT